MSDSPKVPVAQKWYDIFDNAILILKKRGLPLMKHEASDHFPFLIVTRNDFSIEMWFCVEFREDNIVRCAAFQLGTETCKSHTYYEETCRFESEDDLIIIYEQMVQQYVDKFNSDHCGFVLGLMAFGEPGNKAIRMTNNSMGEKKSIEYSKPYEHNEMWD